MAKSNRKAAKPTTKLAQASKDKKKPKTTDPRQNVKRASPRKKLGKYTEEEEEEPYETLEL